MADGAFDLDGVAPLPDCRARAGRGAHPVKGIPGVSMEVPVYCANCHCRAGFATAVESLTFIFVLCDQCSKKVAFSSTVGKCST